MPLQRTLRGKSTTQSYRTPVYYVDLTLRDGINLQEAIQIAKEIDQQSKATGFNQNELDQMARQGYANARFEINAEEGLDVVDEFYSDSESVEGQEITGIKQADGLIQGIQHGLQQSVTIVN